MSELVSLSRPGDVSGGVAVITVRNPPVNALSPGVPEGITAAIDQAVADDSVRAIVLIGAGATFIAGADIREFAKVRAGEKERGEGLHPLLFKLEDCPKPVIAAVHGTAFGGGLETAMACHYRVAIRPAQVGQPEVKLGIIPGAGGTLRLPRLAGVAKGAEMCAIGDPISAQDALDHHILDRIVEGDDQPSLLKGALAFAAEVIANGAAAPKVREKDDLLGDAAANAPILENVRGLAHKKRRGQIAPLKAIDSVEAATKMPFEEARALTARLFMECLQSPQSEALIYAFFGEREVRKIPDVPPDTPTRRVAKAAIVGAGTMGGGIAMNYANAGIPVLLKEMSEEALEKGVARIRANYDRSVQRGRFTPEFVNERMYLIQPTTSYEGFEDADIAVEAVFENMELKKAIFRELDATTKPDAILATNTSTLDVDEIASVASDPSRVIGTHFFSPANVMRLLEIVRGKETAKDVIATSMQLARRLGKVGVLVGNCHGFVGNRMFGPYVRESQFLVEEGAKITDVDKALEDFGMAMGPLAVGDLAGIDIGWRIRQEAKHSQPDGARQPLAEDKLYEMGRYGQKTGAGWYRYGENRRRINDPDVQPVITALAKKAGIAQRAVSAEEIVERTIYALVNEGARILEEGIALRPVDIDIVYLTGYGFPSYKGGPMWYADWLGLDQVYARVREFERQHGYWWKPAPLLAELAAAGKTFAQWQRERS
ncbi:MAG TPA: 3-hydroxyacyl-CoA dehydrogenase NAD-binding domain-containing protein [Bryobacterales bacterium]|nr:3-hydroxyacyl-CoA dehydrogenase NAD-binding domain-containing protein [Bryobacterales bacterium]